MKNIIIIWLLAWGLNFTANAQTGVNTRTPDGSSVAEVNSTNKGLLIPRLNIPSKTNKAPVTATIADGLLAYNNGTALSQTLFFWDAAGSGSWSSALYFKETPKIATFGLIADKSVLDNQDPGGSTNFSATTNPYYTINSGYMPGLVYKQNIGGNWGFAIGEGTYILEVSYLLTAPPANPATRATVLENGYYSMGYFCDLLIYQYTASTNSSANFVVYNKRVEGGTLSKINEQHRVRFVHSFQVSGSGLSFMLNLNIGRRSGSSFNDLATILKDGTIFKLTKLQ